MKTPLHVYSKDTTTPSLAQWEQASDEAFRAQPAEPCGEGHVWERSQGGMECANCGETLDIDLVQFDPARFYTQPRRLTILGATGVTLQNFDLD